MKSYTSKKENLFVALSKIHYSKSGLHGFAGIGLLLASVTEVLQFSWTHEATIHRAYFVHAMGVLLCFGLLERQYRVRLATLHRRTAMTSMWVRAGGNILAFSSLTLCSYAHAKNINHFLNIYAFAMGGLGALATIGASLYDILHVRTAMGTLTATTSICGVLFALPLLHVLLGNEVFADLVEEYPQIPQAFYIVIMLSTMVEGWDAFLIGVCSSGRISADLYRTSAVINWAVIYTSLVCWFLHQCIGLFVALAAFSYFLGCYMLCNPLEKWLVQTKGSGILHYKTFQTDSLENPLILCYSLVALGGFVVCWKQVA